MRSVTDTFLTAIRQSHQMAVQVDAYPPDDSGPISIPVNGGQVTLDRTADIRGRLDLVVSDPAFYPANDTDPLAPYGTELHVQRGVRYPGGALELVSLGWYRIQDATRYLPATQGVAITGWDRSQQVADERFVKAVTVGPDMFVTVIQNLITEVYSGATFSVTADASTIPKTVLDQDRWPAIQQFAQAIGYEVFPDGDGVWVIQPVPDPTGATVVWSVDAGPTGVLVSAQDVVTRDNLPNGIVATGEPSDGTTPVSALVTDDRGGSPTLWGGAYGEVPQFYSSPLIRTSGQASAAALAMLNDALGQNRSIDLTHAPNPALEPGDCISVVYADGTTVQHLLDTIVIPLAVDGQMTGQTRELQAVGV